MIRFTTRFRSVALIGLVTLVYSVLLVLAAGCALAHTDPSQSHHHHHSEQESSGLNSLCTWGCQATADATVAIGPPTTVTEILVGSIDLTHYRFIHSAVFSAVHTRAPPSIPLVRLG
ncbi:MAG: hypothetical protein H8K04_16580 [Nitrospira sp.]